MINYDIKKTIQKGWSQQKRLTKLRTTYYYFNASECVQGL